MRRQRVAVLAADVAGYMQLMEAREEETHARMRHLVSAVIEPCVLEHGGRIVKHLGDGFLACFDAAPQAVHCAVAIQHSTLRSGPEGAGPLRLRMGINLAEIIVEPDDIFGDGVNVAARLQTTAEPGGIVVAEAVAEALRGQPGIALADLGALQLRHLQRPVRAFGIRTSGVVSTLPPPGLPPPPRDLPSIAVLPFRQPDGRPEEAYFAEGLSEGVVHVLSGLGDLFVIAHGSTLTFAAERTGLRDPCAIGRGLGVRYVLDGTLRRAGDRLRLATELIEVTEGSVLRADRLDGAVSELFEMQDRLAAQVVAAIAPMVRERELQRAMRKPPERLTAYDLVLRALAMIPRLDRAEYDQARGLLQQAIAADPGYAPARSYAALWHLIRIAQGWSPSPADDTAEAARNAAAAIERDHHNATALAIHGHMLSFARRDFEAGALFLEQAVAAGPNNPMAWTFSSATSGYLGQGRRAVAHGEQAIRLSPLDPFVYLSEHILSQAHYIAGDHAEAVRWGRRAAARNGLHAANLRTLTASLQAQGRAAEARETAQRLLAVQPGFRLAPFAARTPLTGAILEGFLARLREAGLPD